jgi:shikimate dehydrogenase
LGKLGARRVVIETRDSAKGRAVARRLGTMFQKTRFEAGAAKGARSKGDVREFDLYVNATPLGMKGFGKNDLLSKTARKGALAFDLVYRPEKTSFLASARRRGLKTVGGLDMLIWQALGTWELWFGPIPGKARVKADLARYLRRVLAGRSG